MRFVAAFFAVWLLAAPALAQDRAQTERRLAALRAQVGAAERQVRQARTQEQQALRALEGMQTEIALREQLVAGYRDQVGSLRAEAVELRSSIGRLEGEVVQAREGYRDRAMHAYKHGRRSSLALLLSSESIGQAVARARYLQIFARQRRRQVTRLQSRTAELKAREAAMQASLRTAEQLLAQSEFESRRLAERRAEREMLAANLRAERGRVERDLAQRRSDAQELEGVMREIAAAERRREAEREAAQRAAEEQRRREEAARVAEAARRAEAQRRADEAARRAAEERTRRVTPERRPVPTTPAEAPVATAPAAAPAPAASAPAASASSAPSAPPATTPAAAPATAPSAAPVRPAEPLADRAESVSGTFRQNRGRLPWPTDGTLTGAFGARRDPVYGTTVESIGIDIATRAAAPVRAVFDGMVERVDTSPTYGTYVIVSHGGYTTFYGNLSQVVVRSGQRMTAGQVLGRSGTVDSRRGTGLFFALFEGDRAVNPAGWLRGR